MGCIVRNVLSLLVLLSHIVWLFTSKPNKRTRVYIASIWMPQEDILTIVMVPVLLLLLCSMPTSRNSYVMVTLPSWPTTPWREPVLLLTVLNDGGNTYGIVSWNKYCPDQCPAIGTLMLTAWLFLNITKLCYVTRWMHCVLRNSQNLHIFTTANSPSGFIAPSTCISKASSLLTIERW